MTNQKEMNKEQREVWENAFEKFLDMFEDQIPDDRIHEEVKTLKYGWLAACEFQQKKIDVLVEALEHYADPYDECIGYDIRGVSEAREALKKLKEMQ